MEEVRQRFSVLGEAGYTAAPEMVSNCLMEMGNCFLALGQYDAAAKQYETGIELYEKEGKFRNIAAGKVQLASVRREQKNYPEALRLLIEAKDIFEQYREPGSIAIIWHRIGMVHGQDDPKLFSSGKSLPGIAGD